MYIGFHHIDLSIYVKSCRLCRPEVDIGKQLNAFLRKVVHFMGIKAVHLVVKIIWEYISPVKIIVNDGQKGLTYSNVLQDA